jgi:hypothetical protein
MELLTEVEAARFLRLSPLTLRDWRSKRSRHRGPNCPNYVKIGPRLVRYSLGDLQVYLKKRTMRLGARK